MSERARVSSFDPDEEFRLATFAVGDDLYAIDIMRIKEIVRPLPVTPVPKAPAGMVGVIDLRGQVLPLFDLRLRFDLPPREESELVHVRQLIVSLDGRVLGLLVDQVLDVVNVTRSQLRVGEGVLAGEAAEVFIGVVAVPSPAGDRLALLLNLRRVLAGAHSIPLHDLLRGTNKTLLPAPISPPHLPPPPTPRGKERK
jgi:purine-binding chemotaxis protein CheW